MDLSELFNRSKWGQFGTGELENYPAEGGRLFGDPYAFTNPHERAAR